MSPVGHIFREIHTMLNGFVHRFGRNNLMAAAHRTDILHGTITVKKRMVGASGTGGVPDHLAGIIYGHRYA